MLLHLLQEQVNGVGLDRVTTDKTFVETVGGVRVTMDIGSVRDIYNQRLLLIGKTEI